MSRLGTASVALILGITVAGSAAGASSPSISPVSIAGAAAARGEVSEAQPPFVVASTLDAKKVLPHRIRWIARPNLAASQVSKVEFLIDGRVRWDEEKTPYVYGDDSNWLVTSWLAPGLHRFTVRAEAKDGRIARRTTVARVVAAPLPPAALRGRWEHSFGAGTWLLTVDKVGWKILDPFGTGNLIDVAYFSGGRLQARGGIFTKVDDPFEGNGWCQDLNAPVNYRWSVAGDTLSLTHFGADRCTDGGEAAKQHYAWVGAWTRAA